MSGFRVDKNVEMAMRDGTILRADVWRPADRRRHPALLTRTPTQKEESMTDFFRIDKAVQSGYAVVVQDVRGRFASEGEPHAAGPAGLGGERTDAYDSVEWVADQPWCDGGVGMFGLAGTGMHGFLAAEDQAPHLRAVVAMMAATPEQRQLDSGGAHHLEAVLSTYLFTVANHLQDPSRVRAVTRDMARLAEFLPLRDVPDYFDLPALETSWGDFVAGLANAKPAAFDYSRVEVPFLLVGGFYDLAVNAAVDQFHQLGRRSAGGTEVRSAHRLILGPWTHGDPTPTQGELSFGYFSGSWARTSVGPVCLSFFDRHLRGGPSAIAPVRYFLMGANEWRDADAWPPADAALQRWYLHSGGRANTLDGDGTLSLEAPAGDEQPDRYRYDPLDPVRTRGGRSNRTLGAPGPLDQSPVERRSDVLCYTSAPRAHALDIVGPVTLHLHAASSAVETDFFAKLLDVYPDGRSIEIASGLVRTRFRKGFDQEVLLEAGEVQHYAVNLGPTAARIDVGHRLRVDVCSSNFPFFDRNMNTGNPFGTDAEGVVAEQTVFHDASRPSHVELSVL